MNIWIDADGCPVVKQTLDLCQRHQLPVIIVKNHAVKITSDYAQVITVDNTRDAADFYIASHASKGDLVITQDYGLAAMVLGKNCYVMNQNGLEITSSNVDFILENRHLSAQNRNKRGQYTKHKKRSPQDNQQFINQFEAFIKRGPL